MKTLTITSARQNLGAWSALAARGEEIGIISGAHVIALRPVAIAAADYAEQEYRLTKAELAKWLPEKNAPHKGAGGPGDEDDPKPARQGKKKVNK